MSKRRAVSVLIGLLWSGLLWVGIKLYNGVLGQGVIGYPNTSQLIMYVIFPTSMVLLSACLSIFGHRIPKGVFVGVSLAQLVLMPMSIFVGSGGI